MIQLLEIKLLKAAKDVEHCQRAYHRPVDTVQCVISNLYSSLVTTTKTSLERSLYPNINIVDRQLKEIIHLSQIG